jgi:pimeloyl-ACP methyl ester carboxylesterase
MTRTKGTTVMRLWDWSVPPSGVHREVLSEVPAGWDDLPRADRRPPILFVHGVGHAAWCFAENWLGATARRGFPAYAVSLRGHGGSGGAKRLGRTLMRDYVHDVMQTIAELPQPPVLVGHSMGAVVSQLVADRYPLRGLALLTPAPAHGALPAMLSAFPRHPGDVTAMVLGRTLPFHPETLFTGLDRPTAERYIDRTGRESPLAQYELLRRRRLGPVRFPVLVVGTPEDELIRVADVERTAETYGVEPVWLPGIGHDLMLDSGWETALDVVLDWAETLPGPRP